MGIIWTIIVGFLVGLLARFLKPGDDSMGFILTTFLGIGGAMTAGLLGRNLGWYQPHEPAGFLASILGAIILLFIVQFFRRKSAKS